MKYKILHSTGTKELMEMVNKLIEDGWEPQGGLVSDERHYLQAMVKREEDHLTDELI